MRKDSNISTLLIDRFSDLNNHRDIHSMDIYRLKFDIDFFSSNKEKILDYIIMVYNKYRAWVRHIKANWETDENCNPSLIRITNWLRSTGLFGTVTDYRVSSRMYWDWFNTFDQVI